MGEDYRRGDSFQAFLELWSAHRHRRAPDPAALKVVAEAFAAWMQPGEKRSFDEILGLAGRRGKSPANTDYLLDMRDWLYAHFVGQLVGAGFTVSQAAYAVSEAHRAPVPALKEQLDKLGLRSGAVPGEKTIEAAFQAHGGLAAVEQAGYREPGFRALFWQRDQVLAVIPRHALPPQLGSPRK